MVGLPTFSPRPSTNGCSPVPGPSVAQIAIQQQGQQQRSLVMQQASLTQLSDQLSTLQRTLEARQQRRLHVCLRTQQRTRCPTVVRRQRISAPLMVQWRTTAARDVLERPTTVGGAPPGTPREAGAAGAKWRTY